MRSTTADDRQCPDCESQQLYATRLRGVATLAAQFTARRRYRCAVCGWRGWLMLPALDPSVIRPPAALKTPADSPPAEAPDESPFSLFTSEKTLVARHGASAVFTPSLSQSAFTYRTSGLRNVTAAFAVGIVVGASPFLWRSPASSPDADPAPSTIPSTAASLISPAPPAETSSVGATAIDDAPSSDRRDAVLPPESSAADVRSRREAPAPPRAERTQQPAAAQAATRRVSAPAARPSPPAVRTAAGRFGSLTVNSRPPGAQLRLDGKDVGVTPVVLQRVPIGSHVVRLELAGYAVSGSAVRIVAGQSTKVTINLDRNP